MAFSEQCPARMDDRRAYSREIVAFLWIMVYFREVGVKYGVLRRQGSRK